MAGKVVKGEEQGPPARSRECMMACGSPAPKSIHGECPWMLMQTEELEYAPSEVFAALG